MSKPKPGPVARTADADVIDISNSEDLQLTDQAGGVVRSFLTNLGTFFRDARKVEQAAAEKLTLAKAWKVPSSPEQADAMTVAVRGIKQQRKDAEDLWNICAVTDRLHKRLVAGRRRATEPLDEAERIGNKLHGEWRAAEIRRIDAEERAKREAAEREAQAQRNKELADLEKKKIAAEQSSPELSEREQSFVEGYVETSNAGQSAERAGYADPHKQAARLMGSAKIQKAIKALQQVQALERQQQAVAEQPLDVREVETEQAPTGGTRTHWRGECYDLEQFRQGIKSGAIPLDCCTVDQKALTGYAVALKKNMQFPGCRAIPTTSLV